MHYGYSIPEFLDLCAAVGARPWIVLPSTMGDDEADALGRFFAGPADLGRFDEVVVEFGNESWNPLFRPAGIADPARYAMAATRLFSRLEARAGSASPLVFTLGAAVGNPEDMVRLSEAAEGLDAVAVAPYIMKRLQAGVPPQTALARLFSEATRPLSAVPARLGASRPELAVHAVNLHTLAGDAPPSERNRLVSASMCLHPVRFRRLRVGRPRARAPLRSHA